MLKIGLTGSIGSGKSTVAKVFALLGVPVYFSDIEAKKIVDQPEVTSIITEKFGTVILSEDGRIDRNKLANIIFNNIDALQWLNSLIHPRVRIHFFEWVETNKHNSYVIQESAIMLETGFSKYFDKVVVITCPVEERINRVLSRDKMTRDQILDRMDNQWPEELKVRKADLVINNDDYTLAIPQIVELHQYFLQLSKEKS